MRKFLLPHMTTVRTLIVVAAVRSWAISQMDVKNAFLHGDLCEEVYMHPPLGVEVPPGHVCHLRRALYGLKQAPHAWFQRFSSVVTAACFTPSEYDLALFIHTSPYGHTLILLYVGDMLITGDDPVNTAGADARKWYRKNRIAEVNLLGMIKNRIRVFTYFSLPSFSHPSCYLYCDPS